MGERRPIATRELKISKRLAASLAAAGCTPNGISVAGMVAGALAGAAFWATEASSGAASSGTDWSDWGRLWFVLGAVLVQLRLLANMLDGMVAVENDLTSPVGELYNEVPDRVADVAILVGFGHAAGGWPVMGYLAAISAMMTAYVRAQIAVAGGPQDFCGPMAKPQRMFAVTVAALWCGLLPASWQPAVAGLALPALMLTLVAAGAAVTAGRRLVRGARALRNPR